MVVQWRGEAVTRRCGAVPSCCTDEDEWGIVSGSGSGSMAADDSRAAATPSSSSALISGLTWCSCAHRVAAGGWERLGHRAQGFYSGAVAMVLDGRRGTGQGHM